MVDYYVYFKDFDEPVSTTDLKIILNQELQGFQPDGSADGVAELGRFRVDPNFTDFISKSHGHHKTTTIYCILPPQRRHLESRQS